MTFKKGFATILIAIVVSIALPTYGRADSIVTGLDLSGSNDLVRDEGHAGRAAEAIGKRILRLKIGDKVVVGFLGTYGHSENRRRLKIVISKKNRPAEVAKAVKKLIGSIPNMISEGKLKIQNSTNLIGFLEDESFLNDCKAEHVEYILVTDGIEHAMEVNGKSLVDGKVQLPKPDSAFLDGCDLIMLGIGKWSKGGTRTAKNRLIGAWRPWSQSAGVKNFKPLPKIAEW